MRLLILTQYYPPEVGAPQNRLHELAKRLRAFGVEISVLTAMPNYPQMEIYPAYRGKKFLLEEIDGIPVYRSSIFVSQSRSVVSRLRNYFSFVISSARAGSKIPGKFDFLLCESPPLFLGYSALYLSGRKHAKLIFNVSDLWPESAEKLGVVSNRFLLQQAYRLEAKLYKRSALVTGQTQGICWSINARFPEVPTWWLPNGVDLSYYDPEKTADAGWRRKHGFSESDFILLYAGIIGIAQGLEIIPEAAAGFSNETSLKFVLMGSGPEKEKLQQLTAQRGLNNVFFLETVTKAEMPSVLRSVNAAIVPLRKLELFLGAIPSKIFENLAMEVPLLLGVDGEARELFITQAKAGIYFEPGNSESLAEAVRQLRSDPGLARTMGKRGRTFVAENFNREAIASEFYKRLQRL